MKFSPQKFVLQFSAQIQRLTQLKIMTVNYFVVSGKRILDQAVYSLKVSEVFPPTFVIVSNNI